MPSADMPSADTPSADTPSADMPTSPHASVPRTQISKTTRQNPPVTRHHTLPFTPPFAPGVSTTFLTVTKPVLVPEDAPRLLPFADLGVPRAIVAPRIVRSLRCQRQIRALTTCTGGENTVKTGTMNNSARIRCSEFKPVFANFGLRLQYSVLRSRPCE